MSNISSIVSALMTPDCWNNAFTATSLAASAAVWLLAARTPALVRPALTVTMGFDRAMRRASLANRRGFLQRQRVNVHIAGDKQIEVAVPVVITERAARVPANILVQSRRFANFREGPVAIVLVQ